MAFGGGRDSGARVPVIGSAVVGVFGSAVGVFGSAGVGVFGSTVVGVFGSTVVGVFGSTAVGVFGSTAVVSSPVLVKAVPGARCSPSECGELYWGRIRAMG